MRFTCILLTFLFSTMFYGQEIVVFSDATNEPLDSCVIYASKDVDKKVFTNERGSARLDQFFKNELLVISHLGYDDLFFKKKSSSKYNYNIFLSKTPESLGEIVLSVSRKKEAKVRVAERVEIKNLEDIQQLAPQNSADLLASVSGVKVQKTQFGGGSPVLRGMEANRVLLVIDGVRMNNAIYRSGHLQNAITVSPAILNRIEVIFGPSSVIYGSDALGGVVHYYTKTALPSEKFDSKVNFMSRYGSVNNEFSNQVGASLSFKKWASYTAVSYATFDDLRMGKNRRHGFEDWGKVFEYSNNSDTYYNSKPVLNSDPNIQKNTGYNQLDVLQKFYYQLSKNSHLKFNLQHSTSSDIPRFDKLTEKTDEEVLKFAEWYYGPQNRTLISTQYNFDTDYPWLSEGSVTLAYQKIKESRINRKFTSLDRSYRDEVVDVWSLNGDFSVPLSENSNRQLSYGMELTHNNVASSAIGKTLSISGNQINGFDNEFKIQTRYPDGGSTYSSAAIYTAYRQDISKKSTLNTGIRYTHTFLTAEWIDTTFVKLPETKISLNNSALTATIGYIIRPNNKWQINSVISSGFRSPNIDDIGKVREKNGKVTVPNTSLKPEYAYNVEFGAQKFFNDKKLNLGFNIYYTLLHNYIARIPYSIGGSGTIIYDGEALETLANVNKGNAYISGATVNYSMSILENFNSSSSITYTKGEAYDTKLPLSSIPPLFGHVNLSYDKYKFDIGLNFRFNAAKDEEDYNLVEGIDNIEETPFNQATGRYYGTPSWYTFDFYSAYDFTNQLKLQLRVDNIFDQHYKEFASAISAPGRNFSISLIYNQ